MNVCFILMSEVNGYKNVENVFAHKEDAEKAMTEAKNEWNAKDCYYIFETPIF